MSDAGGVCYRCVSAGGGFLPSIMSTAFSPIMIVGALVFPEVIVGMTLASTTLRLSSPWTL